MDALIVTDIQPDFLPGGALPVPHGDEIIPLVNRLQECFPLVVATQDWHPQDHVSFASNHPGKKPGDRIPLFGSEQILWPDHCVQDSPGAALSPQLVTKRVEAIIRKGTDREIDSYSTFFDNEHRKASGLAGYLRGRGVDHVYFVGLAADFCVNYSLHDAVGLGFEATLIEDATRAIGVAGFPAVRQRLQEAGVGIVQAEAVMAGRR